MPRTALSNLERLYQVRYRNAHSPLTDDPEAAETTFVELLYDFRMRLWMRVQCNAILAAITDDVDDADKHLADARHVLELFREDAEDLASVEGHIAEMEEHLDEVENEIEERRK